MYKQLATVTRACFHTKRTCSTMEHDQLKRELKKKEKIRQGATEWNETEAKIEIFINILNK